MQVKCIKDYKGIYGTINKGKVYEVTVITDYSYGVKNDLNNGCLFDKDFFEEIN